MKRAIIAVVAATLLMACNESNPLIGKWTSDDSSMGCSMFGTIEFTEKLVIKGRESAPVTYSRDGARYIAAAQGGRTFVFEKAGNGLKMVNPFKCEMVKMNTELLTQGAVCSGIFKIIRTSDELEDRIKKTMSPSDKILDQAAVNAFLKLHDKLERALEELTDEKILSEEQRRNAVESGEAIGNKIATYAEATKRLDECSKTARAVVQIAGTD